MQPNFIKFELDSWESATKGQHNNIKMGNNKRLKPWKKHQHLNIQTIICSISNFPSLGGDNKIKSFKCVSNFLSYVWCKVQLQAPLSRPILMTLDHAAVCVDQCVFQYKHLLSLLSDNTGSALDQSHPNTHQNSPTGIDSQTELLLAAVQKNLTLKYEILLRFHHIMVVSIRIAIFVYF